ASRVRRLAWTPPGPTAAPLEAAAGAARSTTGQASVSRRTGSNAGWSGDGAGRISCARFGAQLRHRPSATFQQLPQVYWRQYMQKLKVEWNAPSCCAVTSRSSSLRASARASSSDESSLITQFLTPRLSVLNWPSRRVLRGATDSNV